VGGLPARALPRQAHALFIDVNELTDRTENTLKFIGEVYAARLGLETWRANVRETLKTVNDISRCSVEQSSISRGQFLELAIVLILVLDLALVFMGVMK
jgi:hypothetical protein